MRIWDIEPARLCRQHLLGEHKELHGIWNIHVKGLNGYSKHPEVKRWKGYLYQLAVRHEKLAKELEYRNYNHNSELYPGVGDLEARHLINRFEKKPPFIDSVFVQIKKLRAKKCGCHV